MKLNRKLTVLLLNLAMVASLGAVTALAKEAPAGPAAPQGAVQVDAAVIVNAVPAASAVDAKDVADAKGTEDAAQSAYVPDAVGTVSYANLEKRLKENNFTARALQESIDSINEINYDKMINNLRDTLNSIAAAQAGLVAMNAADSYTYGMLEQNYAAIRKSFDALWKGDMQKDNAAVIHQLKNTQDQMLMGAQSLYVSLTELGATQQTLERQLTALERTAAEMELRYQLGQVSALQLEQVKAGRASLVSSLDTVKNNLFIYKMQLEQMIGAEITGSIVLAALPEVTSAQLDAMDVEKDLETAKTASYEVYSIQKTLDDAKKTYTDAQEKYGYDTSKYEVSSAKHTWQAAQYTYSAAMQSYELRFRTLYAQTVNYRQILAASEVSLVSQQSSFAATKLKYEQGAISTNAYLSAQDELAAAQDAAATAKRNLFTALTTYQWAAQNGILN